MPVNDIFIIQLGPNGNLGDAIIRRHGLEWARTGAVVHSYVGDSNDTWVEHVGLRERDRVYKAQDRATWIRRLLAGRGKRALVFDPGEVPLGRMHLKSEAVFLALTFAVRLRGGVVIRPPRGIAHLWGPTGAMHRLSSRCSTLVLWRNERSGNAMRSGIVTADIAFYEKPVPGLAPKWRRTLVISLRADRPFPDDVWIEGVKTFAEQAELQIITVSQVDDDEPRSAKIAASIGSPLARHDPWSNRSTIEQEKHVRGLYGSAALVLSDRLHVLIVAALSDAVPIELVDAPRGKVASHFSAIGVENVSHDSANLSVADIVELLTMQHKRMADLSAALDAAQAELAAHRDRVRAVLSR